MAKESLVLTWEDGKVKSAGADTELDGIYRRMFAKAKRSARLNAGSVENGIKIVLFGTIYLEAILNRFVKDLMFSRLAPGDFAANIWRAIEKTNIISKFSVAIASSPAHRERMNDYLGKARTILDQRNRLVHSKEEDRVWLEVFAGGSFEELMKGKKVRRLRGPKRSVINRYIACTEDLVALIEELCAYHFGTARGAAPKKPEDSREQ